MSDPFVSVTPAGPFQASVELPAPLGASATVGPTLEAIVTLPGGGGGGPGPPGPQGPPGPPGRDGGLQGIRGSLDGPWALPSPPDAQVGDAFIVGPLGELWVFKEDS